MDSSKPATRFVNANYPLSELTGKIIGCAMEVHRILGSGFQEVIYQRAPAPLHSSPPFIPPSPFLPKPQAASPKPLAISL